MKAPIYVSTGGFANQTATVTSRQLIEAGVDHIELSAGVSDESQLADLIQLSEHAKFCLHNYFPPPPEPFVFNLTSEQTDVVDLSIRLVQKALEWTHRLGGSVYSFHAGYLIDPAPSELGAQLRTADTTDRSAAIDRFIDRVNCLSDEAHALGIKLLIENNVLSQANYDRFMSNPLLMVELDDTVEIMQRTNENVSLLVDVAHLKVSANTLRFNPVRYLERANDWIEAYHLSDNNGLQDSNGQITPSDWYWSHLKREVQFVTLEVYRQTAAQLRAMQIMACHLVSGQFFGSSHEQ